MSKFVFFSADRCTVELTVDSVTVGRAYDAGELRNLMISNGITRSDDFFKSSSIDFCEEEGFVEGGAQRIIDRAIKLLPA